MYRGRQQNDLKATPRPAPATPRGLLQELRPTLERLAKQRKEVSKTVTTAFIIAIPATIALGFILVKLGVRGDAMGLALIPLAIGGVVAYLAVSSFTRDYKTNVFRVVVSEVFPSFRYQPDSGMDERTFLQSRLFSKNPDRFHAEDLFTGTIDGVQIAFSEVHAKERVKRGKNTHYETIFRGTLFQTEFNKELRHMTIVQPDGLGTSIGQALQGLLRSVTGGPKLDRVRLEDPVFEKLFEVYGTDQVESRYVLSPSLMARFVDLKRRMGNAPLRFSFIGTRLYIAVSHGKDLFEPKIFGKVNDVAEIQEFIDEVRMFERIVAQLKLNEFLWSKAAPEAIPTLDIGVG